MTAPKYLKLCCISSFSLIAVWLFSTVIAILSQDSLMIAYGAPEVSEGSAPVIPFESVLCLFCAAAFTAANIIMCLGRCRLVPLILSAVSAGVMPIFGMIIVNMQSVMYARLGGSDFLVRYGAISGVIGYISYPLTLAAVLTVASAAVYMYSRGEARNSV